MTSPPRENSSLNTAKRDRDMALAESDRAALRRPNPWVGLWIVLSAAFMGIMDVFITAVTAPAIRADLGATTADMQMILAAYNFSFGLVLITGGRLGDLYGRRRIFSVGSLCSRRPRWPPAFRLIRSHLSLPAPCWV